MKILIPLPFDISCQAHGRNLRIVNLLNELSKRCEIQMAAVDERIARSAGAVLPHLQVLTAPAGLQSDSAPTPRVYEQWWMRRVVEFFGYNPALHTWMSRLRSQADVLLGFDLVSAMYLAQPGSEASSRTPAVCDLIDDPWLTFRSSRRAEQLSPAGAKVAIAVQTLRRKLLPQMDMLVAVAPRDAESLSQATGHPVRVVPNGVAISESPPACGNREPLVVFTGAMNFPPNEQAARYLVQTIWPRVRHELPEARLALVGADPTPTVRALAGEPGVTVTGRVDDMKVWLRRARVATAPMVSGTGLKNKILEACAQACPVVATPLAATAIPAGAENGILVAADPAAFAAYLIELLTDSERAATIGRAGAQMVREQLSWPRAADALWAALRDCLAAAGRTVMDPRRHSAVSFDRFCEPRIGREVATHATA